MRKTNLKILVSSALIIFWIIAVITPLLKGVFYFTFDQARDLIWTKNQIDFSSPSLIGPWGSLAGVYFGPLWFWLLAIPVAIFSGSPVAVTVFNALLILLTILIGGFYFWRKDSQMGFGFLILGLASPYLQSVASYAFSQHLLPPITLILIFSYLKAWDSGQRKYLCAAAFLVGLMFHGEPPTAIFSFLSLAIISFFVLKKNRSLNFLSLVCLGISFTLPLLPLVVFDYRHEWLQARSVVAYFTGSNHSLGGELDFVPRFFDRLHKFFYAFSFSFSQSTTLGFLILGGITLAVAKLRQEKMPTIFKVLAIYLVTFYISALVYRADLKGFYLDGLSILFVMLLTSVLVQVVKFKRAKILAVGVFMLLFLVNTNFLEQVNNFKENYPQFKTSTSIYANEVSQIDWIYSQAKGEAFSVYTFSPAIYDFPQQYIIMTHGLQKNGYLPAEFSYLPSVPEYVQKKNAWLEKHKTVVRDQPAKVFLIVDMSPQYASYRNAWLANFSGDKFQLLNEVDFVDKTVIKEMKVI